jgi:hypothetical protein
MAPFFGVVMNIKNIMLSVCLLATSSCSYWQSWRKPAQATSSSEMGEHAQSIIDRVATREINPQNCQAELGTLIDKYSKLPATLPLDVVKQEGQDLLDQSFEARMALHSMLGSFPRECKIQMKELNLKMRMMEDLVGVYYYNVPQIPSSSINYKKVAPPIYEADKYQPYHVGVGIDPKAKFEFKNGDIMITKGVSFVSSTISEIASPKSLFSHIVFVHVGEKTKMDEKTKVVEKIKVVETIESYVGKGVSIFPIEEALKNENARIVVLRAKDQELAARAVDYMYNKVQLMKANHQVIPYDYSLDFSDNSKLSCEEVAYDSFKTVSEGKTILPEIESEITMNDAQFLKRIGVKKGAMMVPTDMETDSRFDIVLDWTDYRIMRDSWRKDALLGEMFRWIQEYNYSIHENLTSIGAKAIWSTRYIPGVWQVLSKLAGLDTNFMKDIPSLTISTIASLKTIGGILLPVVTEADQEHFKQTGQWMTKAELYKALDDYRQTNPKKLRKVFREK